MFPISRSELEAVKRLPARRRHDGLASFSTNWRGKTWHFKTWGLTPEEKRERVRSCEIVFMLAHMCREERPGGGRFFVDEKGAFYKDQGGRRVLFVRFQIRG